MRLLRIRRTFGSDDDERNIVIGVVDTGAHGARDDQGRRVSDGLEHLNKVVYADINAVLPDVLDKSVGVRQKDAAR